MIRNISSSAMALATVSQPFITSNSLLPSRLEYIYQFSQADKTPKSQAALKMINIIDRVYLSFWEGSQVEPLKSVDRVLMNLPSKLLEDAYNNYITDHPDSVWDNWELYEPYRMYAAAEPLKYLLNEAESQKSNLTEFDQTLLSGLKRIASLVGITSAALTIQKQIYLKYGGDYYSDGPLNDFSDVTGITTYGKNTDSIAVKEWARQRSFGSVIIVLDNLDNLIDNLEGCDKNRLKMPNPEIDDYFNEMDQYVESYQRSFIALLQKYNMVPLQNIAQISQGADHSYDTNDNDVQNVLQKLQSQIPGFDLNNPENMLKAIGLIQLLGNKDFDNLNLDQDTLDKLKNQLNNFDLSGLDPKQLGSLLEKIDLNKIDLSHINLDHLDISHLDQLDELAKSGVLNMFSNVTVVQKIVMGLAAGVSAVLSGTMGFLSRVLFKRNASGKSKAFVVSTTAVLALIAIGLIAGIFIS